MRILIVEDDFASRKFMEKFLSKYGACDVAIGGLEALNAVLFALSEEKPYDLICLDIMLPKLDGIKVLQGIRQIEKKKKIEEENRAKIIMVTALNDRQSIETAQENGCDAYVWKPIDMNEFIFLMKSIGLIKEETGKG